MNLEEKNLELLKLSELSSKNWEDLREKSTYEYKHIEFPFGTRLVAMASERTKMLQTSRGPSFGKDASSYDEFMKSYVSNSKKIHEFDQYRINELFQLRNQGLIQFDSEKYFYEFGFRSTSVMDFWKSTFKNVKGCDVVNPCVYASQDLGYSTELIDLNFEIPNLSNVQLLVAYHVLEHLTNPLTCIQKVFASLEKGSIFHAEIPIEPDGPRIRYAHLFPFHKDDLSTMMKIAGFRIVHKSTTPFPGGPEIERVISIKE
jgi:hypothetical protein